LLERTWRRLRTLTGTGNSAANAITGNGGNNTLSGADGNDTLDGGAGNCTMASGQGADQFRFGRSGGSDIVDAYDTDGGAEGYSYLNRLPNRATRLV
jgi:Ca2+-binding RTX toxin-like protein